MDSAQKPLELILARNLLTSISTPAMLLDDKLTVLFYNEAAAAMLGRAFEESGQMTADEWSRSIGPLGEDGKPLDVERTALTVAVRSGRPAHGTFRIRTASHPSQPIEAAAFPIIASDHTDSSGAMIMFWPRSGNGGSDGG